MKPYALCHHVSLLNLGGWHTPLFLLSVAFEWSVNWFGMENITGTHSSENKDMGNRREVNLDGLAPKFQLNMGKTLWAITVIWEFSSRVGPSTKINQRMVYRILPSAKGMAINLGASAEMQCWWRAGEELFFQELPWSSLYLFPLPGFGSGERQHSSLQSNLGEERG